ncbi:MAG: hypothetical protein ABJL72_12230 [Roseobacter sp.]
MTEIDNDLRPLTAEEGTLTELHPLPEGVPDALVNKSQLEIGLGVSQTTISTWLRRPENPLPFESAGANGRSYQFRLSIAYAWMRQMRADEESARAQGDAAAQQLQLSLLGGETATATNGKMTLSDQRKVMELELIRTSAARERGELVRRDDVVTAFENVFASIRDALDALPDRLGRELGLEGRDQEKCQIACDDVLLNAHRAVSEVVGDGESEGGII